MHNLVFKQTESPKKMEKVTRDFDKLEFPIEGDIEARHHLFPPTPTDEYCQPCHLPSLSRHLPHSSTCSYGIQALLHNVHRGYATDGDRTPDQTTSFNDEQRDEFSPQHESEILREWKRKKEEELQERQRESQAKLDHILEQAAIEREKFYKEREARIEAKKQLNRESEAKSHAKVGAQDQQGAGGNLWGAVAALIDLPWEGECRKSPTTSSTTNPMKPINSLSPKSMMEHQLATPKKPDGGKNQIGDHFPKAPKKSTDLSRMREILLKLQHQPLVR